MNIIGIFKKTNTVVEIATAVITAYQTMNSVFKWYEKKHGNKNKQQPLVRPIIKGILNY